MKKLLNVLLLFLIAACKTASPSDLAATTMISEAETLDLTTYYATTADYEKFREELGDQYAHMLEQLNDAMQNGRRQLTEVHGTLVEEERVAIYHYSSMGYRLLNKVLRKSDIDATAKQAGFIKVLSSALNKLPPVKATVYRGGMLPAFDNADWFSPFHTNKTVDPDRLASFKVGQIFVDKGFMSTSRHDPDGIRQAFGCREALYTIQSINGRDISMFSALPAESEILFVPGSEFKIKKIQNTFPPANQCQNEVVELEVEEIQAGSR